MCEEYSWDVANTAKTLLGQQFTYEYNMNILEIKQISFAKRQALIGLG